jgi:Flp pilus assembly protein TadG
MKNIIKFFRKNEGVAAIEFALIFPIFILFFFMVLEYSIMSFGNSVMQNMVNMIARQSSMGCYDAEYVTGNPNACTSTFFADSTGLKNEIIRKSIGLVDANDSSRFTFTAGPVGSYTTGLDMGQGGEIRVIRMAYDWPIFFSYLSSLGLIGNTANFETVTVVRNERFGNLGVR